MQTPAHSQNTASSCLEPARSFPWYFYPSVITLVLTVILVVWPWFFRWQRVVLMTDFLLFVLTVLLVYGVAYLRTKAHLRESWRQVFRRPVALGASVVLGLYLLITVFDSIHFRKPLETLAGQTEQHYSNEVLSLVDLVLEPLRRQQEKTYSAPFASQLFQKEQTIRSDGSKVRDYPPLKFGGQHLRPGQAVVSDVVLKALVGTFIGLGVWGLVVIVVMMLGARGNFGKALVNWRTVWQGRTYLPWRSALLTSLVLLIFLCITYYLSFYYHVFGTDKIGQDTLYQSFKSIRTGVLIGTLTTLVMLPFALVLGVVAGYFRGWVDDLIQYLYTTLNSIPGVLLIAAAVLNMDVYITNNEALFKLTADRGDIKLLALCAILGITSWTGLCRLLRGESLKMRELEFIQAARAFGASHSSIIRRHILPNVMHIVMIVVVLDFSGLVLAEAVLSYIGIGVDSSIHSWGNMINGARLEMAREPMVWWSLIAALVFMFTLVLAANLFADAVRDAFDPKLRKG